jgi:tRNA 2-thiouridine synthesizing protein A
VTPPQRFFRAGRRQPASPDTSAGTGPAGRPGSGTARAGAASADRPAAAPGATAAEPALSPALTLNALGKKCPVPIIMLADRIRDVSVGQLVEVLADDPAAKTDLPAWCALKSQEFVRSADLTAGWSFLVRRSY